jgi:hypothetical protein
MIENELTPINETVICHTENCENCDIAIEIVTYEDCIIVCGPCGQIITDITINQEPLITPTPIEG